MVPKPNKHERKEIRSLLLIATKYDEFHFNNAEAMPEGHTLDWLTIVSLVQRWGPFVCRSKIGDQEWTVLHFAAWHHKVDYARLFIAQGSDILDQTYLGYTPLYLAALSRPDYSEDQSTEKMRSLIYMLIGRHPFFYSFMDVNFRCPVRAAIESSNLFVLKLLVKNPMFDPHLSELNPTTPLMLVVQNMDVMEDWEEMTVLLLESEFNLYRRDTDGRNIFDMAEENLPHSLAFLDLVRSFQNKTGRFNNRPLTSDELARTHLKS